MKKAFAFLFSISLQSALVFCQTGQNDLPVLSGPYLGQNPPENTPELFAPGYISRDNSFEHSAAVFSPGGNEVYWSARLDGQRYFRIYYMKLINGRWTGPTLASFSQDPDRSFNQPSFSPDGNQLFFDTYSDIWVVDRQGEDWSEAWKISPKINPDGTGASIHIQTITNNGSVYFIKYYPNEQFGKKSIIHVSRKINGNYTEPEILGEIINSAGAEEMSVAVASDESYMIIEETKDNRLSELFICYNLKGNSWSGRIRLPIARGRFPSVSPDGKYLFFMDRDKGVYWVNSSFIKDLRPEELK